MATEIRGCTKASGMAAAYSRTESFSFQSLPPTACASRPSGPCSAMMAFSRMEYAAPASISTAP
jgi:hypothetical protein